jgi:hypothetical protein
MEITAIPPTTPPAIAPAFEPLNIGGGVEVEDPVPVEDALTEDVPVEDTLVEDMSVEDALAGGVPVYTPDAPKIAPGPYSGLSI